MCVIVIHHNYYQFCAVKGENPDIPLITPGHLRQRKSITWTLEMARSAWSRRSYHCQEWTCVKSCFDWNSGNGRYILRRKVLDVRLCHNVRLSNTGEPWMNIKSGRVIVDVWTTSAIAAEGGSVCVTAPVLYTLAVKPVKKKREGPFKIKVILNVDRTAKWRVQGNICAFSVFWGQF